MSGISETGNTGGTENPVDTSQLDALTTRANDLYYQVMDMNMDFQEQTAGAKVAKDQSGKVSA